MNIGKLRLRRVQPKVLPVMYGETELLVYHSLWSGRINVPFWGSPVQFVVHSDYEAPALIQIDFIRTVLSYSRSIRRAAESGIRQFATTDPCLGTMTQCDVLKQICDPMLLIPKEADIVLPLIQFDFIIPLVDGIRSFDVRISDWSVESVSLDAG